MEIRKLFQNDRIILTTAIEHWADIFVTGLNTADFVRTVAELSQKIAL
jgi:hypothetical protein